MPFNVQILIPIFNSVFHEILKFKYETKNMHLFPAVSLGFDSPDNKHMFKYLKS